MFEKRRLFRGLTLAVFLGAFSLSLTALETKILPGTWTDALTVAALPDGSLLVGQRSGLVDRLLPDGKDFKSPSVWADLCDNGHADLLSLAVDPDFLSSGYIYAVTRTTVGQKPVVRLTRWRATGDIVVLNKVLVDNLPSGSERPGGVVRVGPDGYLWVGIGDGGAEASEVTAENLRGVLLRYNADGTIPTGNPDPYSAVWARGFRDPAGLAWQPDSGRLYSLDRGPVIPRGTMDRLDIVEKNNDYGWPKYVGRDWAKGVARPVTYCSSGHSWIPNGAVFATAGEWKGSLLFAGSGQGYLYRISLDSKNPTKPTFYEELVGGELGPLMDVALGTDGQPYLLSQEKLYRLIP